MSPALPNPTPATVLSPLRRMCGGYAGQTKSREKSFFANALVSYERSVDYFEQIGMTDEKNTLVKRDVAQSLKNVGEMLVKLNRTEPARQAYQKVLGILKTLQAQNALGEFDRPMLDEVQAVLRKL